MSTCGFLNFLMVMINDGLWQVVPGLLIAIFWSWMHFDDSLQPSQMDFKHSPFWVQVHDLPLICMSVAVASKIGLSLGEFVSTDVAGEGGRWGRCLRIWVILNLTKPLEHGHTLHVAWKTYWANFKYEKLPLLCFSCGRIIHGPSGCPEQKLTGGEAWWGVWLRADVQ